MPFKRLTILAYAIFGFFIMSMSIHVSFEFLVATNKWMGLIIGVLFMALGWIIYRLGRQMPLFYVLAFLLNMIGVGASITAYYVFKAYALQWEDYLTAVVIAMVVLSGFGLLTGLKGVKKHVRLVISLTILIAFVSSLILWLSVEAFTGLSFYFLNISYFFMIGMINVSDSLKDLSKEMAVVSFGSFILISIIVLIVLSEGEALEGVGDGVGEFLIPGREKKKNVG
ncbi:MAG: hypothetical protein K9K93_02505 [Acholeplasmataceae bacterium]|nr:hypothetical protein [Acholeplasmataceae bacterium]